MFPRSGAARAVLGLCGSLAILGLAVGVFLLLPERVATNDFVGGMVFAGAIVLCAAVARVTHPDAGGPRPVRSER